MASVEILPSVLAADFTDLASEIRRVEAAGVSMLHLDVMDGHFVPNISFGPPVIQSIRKMTGLKFDVHLMIEKPDLLIPSFVEAGAWGISVHQEASPHLNLTLSLIRGHGCRAGVVINPATPISTLEEVLDQCDYVLVMSVNPGFGGQKFIPRALDKVRALAAKREQMRLGFAIEIDGGIGLENAAECVRAGCDWLVAGTSIFRSADATAAARKMRTIAEGARGVLV